MTHAQVQAVAGALALLWQSRQVRHLDPTVALALETRAEVALVRGERGGSGTAAGRE